MTFHQYLFEGKGRTVIKRKTGILHALFFIIKQRKVKKKKTTYTTPHPSTSQQTYVNDCLTRKVCFVDIRQLDT